jgi:hypothetical protein
MTKKLTPYEIIDRADEGAIVEILDQVFLASAETWLAHPQLWDPNGDDEHFQRWIGNCDYMIKTVPEQAKETLFLAKRIAVERKGKFLGVRLFGSSLGKTVCMPTTVMEG